MLHALSTLIGCELRFRDDAPAGRVRAFLIDGAGWALRYARVRLAHEPGGPDRLLPAAAFPPMAHDDGAMMACLTAQELARGLPMEDGGAPPAREAEAALHAALHWQPYWLADGHAAGAGAHHHAEGAPSRHSEGAPSRHSESAPSRDAGGARLHDAAGAIGATLHCGGAPFGHVCDLLVDTEDWSVPALRIAAGDGARLHLPSRFVRNARWEESRFDSDVRAAVLACAPLGDGPLPGRDELAHLARHLSGSRTAP